ncbi:MAG TPA: hypothetical protein VHE12_03705 [bacterium]|nr:hypothetical protein [bacterium]
MKKLFILGCVLLSAGVILLSGPGCGSSPSSPSGPTPTPTVSILWGYPTLDHFTNISNVQSVLAFVYVNVGGQPVTDAAVSLAGTFTGAPVALTYQHPVTFGSLVLGDYENTGLNYEANQTYILTTTAQGKTAAATLIAPGGNITLSADTDGSVTQVSWDHEGSYDLVEVYERSPGAVDTFLMGPDVNSPLAVPNSGVSNAYGGGSGASYDVTGQVENRTATVSNASITVGGYFYARDERTVRLTLP